MKFHWMHKWCNMAITTALFFVVLILIPMFAAEDTVGTETKTKQEEEEEEQVGPFDYFQLVQRWPISYCYRNPNCKRDPLPNNFTLHGLWPDNFESPLLYCANKTVYKEYKKTDSLSRLIIRNKLEISWTDLNEPNEADALDKQTFWTHEWVKHGTCSLSRFKQDEYFDLALKLKEKNNILDTLQQYGITPGSRYLAKNFTDAITHSTACEPDINCWRISEGNYRLLELIICYAPNGRNCIDCPYSSRFWKCGEAEDFRNWKKKKKAKKEAAEKKGENKDDVGSKKKEENKGAVDQKKKGEKKDFVDAKKKGEKKNAVDPKKKGEKKHAAYPKKKREKKDSVDPEKKGEKKQAADPKKRRKKKDAVDPEKKGDKKKAADPKKRRKKKDVVDPEQKGEKKHAADLRKSSKKKDAVDPKKERKEKDAVDPKKKGERKDAVDEKKKKKRRGYQLVEFPSP